MTWEHVWEECKDWAEGGGADGMSFEGGGLKEERRERGKRGKWKKRKDEKKAKETEVSINGARAFVYMCVCVNEKGRESGATISGEAQS